MAFIPVYCVTRIPEATFNQFLTQANSATHRCEYITPMAHLMTSTTTPESLESGTPGPVADDTLGNIPFIGWSVNKIIEWAQQNLLYTDLSPRSMVIMDQRSMEDATCLLVTEADLPEGESIEDKWLRKRSDFESSVVSLMTIEMGCGGTDHLDTDYEGSDGVLRISVRDRG